MTTVGEIEKAIEVLPAGQIRELAEWLEDYQLMLSASTDVFRSLDEEGGEGDQWRESGPAGAKSGS